jgi:hypothetical protein
MMNFRLHFCVLLDVNLEIVSLVRAYTQWRNTTEQPVLWEDVPSMLGTLTCHEHCSASFLDAIQIQDISYLVSLYVVTSLDNMTLIY